MYMHLDKGLVAPNIVTSDIKAISEETWPQVLLVLYMLTDMKTFIHLQMCIFNGNVKHTDSFPV